MLARSAGVVFYDRAMRRPRQLCLRLGGDPADEIRKSCTSTPSAPANAHRIAFRLARELAWDVEREASGSPAQFAHVCTFGRGNRNTQVPCP
jgi:hypothetical protein